MLTERMDAFVSSNIDADFGLSIQELAPQVGSYGRFSAWLNGDVSRITEVLEIVENNGVSPAFFAAYERTEGYNSSWGWLNRTNVNGSPTQDANSVSQWVATQSQSTSDNPAWIDYANYKDFVPNSVKQEGNAHFASLPTGTIGRVIIAGTAAATWEVYYPQGLQSEYNGVQDYGAPINHMIEAIEEWGGVIGEDSGGGGTNPNPPSLDPNDIANILENGKLELMDSLTIDFQPAIDFITEEVQKMFNRQLFNISHDYNINDFFKMTHTFGNTQKINPTTKFIRRLLEIVTEGVSLIEINFDVDNVFSNIGDSILDLIPTPSNPNPEETNGVKIFPVDYDRNGINFWQSGNWGAGSLQYDMLFGERANGDFHAGYDIGGGGSTHPVYAITDGVVTHAGVGGGWGNYITIEHSSDNYHTLYAHLDSMSVSNGDTIKAGQQIGVMGATGGNYAIHLHVELSETGQFSDGNTVNPESYLEITGDNETGLPKP